MTVDSTLLGSAGRRSASGEGCVTKELRTRLFSGSSRLNIVGQPLDPITLSDAVAAIGPATASVRFVRSGKVASLPPDKSVLEVAESIGVPIDFVITAEQAGAYKPSLRTFAYALEVIGCKPDELLHVAQGFEYDIMPAHALGWNRVWINRYGKTGDPAYGPYHELPDLSGLPGLVLTP